MPAKNVTTAYARIVVSHTLANTMGGKILLGVRDDGAVVGIGDSNELRARIQDVARNCDPPVRVVIEPIGQVVVVHVRESDAKPVQCREGFYWRQGAVTQKLTRDEIRDFFQREGSVHFDVAINRRFRYPDDLDREKLDAWIEQSRISVRGPVEDILVNIEAAERAGGQLLFRNVGVLFFAREVRRFFNQAYITCILFRGTERVHILDRKDLAGGVVADIEDSLRFIERNTRTAYRIERLRRDEVPQYPMTALREAITNAVMHRDWFNEGANVFVEVYADRIEVVSPGGLPAGLAAGELGTRSVRRNALIADLLHRIGFIEKAGTGIGRMRDGARQHGSPEPEFRVDGFFTVTFRPLSVELDELAGEGAHLGTKLALSQHQVEILRKSLEEQSLVDLMSVTGRSDRSKFRSQVLGPLFDAGLVEMTLPDKPRSSKQRYRITPLGREVLEQSRTKGRG